MCYSYQIQLRLHESSTKIHFWSLKSEFLVIFFVKSGWISFSSSSENEVQVVTPLIRVTFTAIGIIIPRGFAEPLSSFGEGKWNKHYSANGDPTHGGWYVYPCIIISVLYYIYTDHKLCVLLSIILTCVLRQTGEGAAGKIPIWLIWR